MRAILGPMTTNLPILHLLLLLPGVAKDGGPPLRSILGVDNERRSCANGEEVCSPGFGLPGEPVLQTSSG
jgi:hypothetical protein